MDTEIRDTLLGDPAEAAAGFTSSCRHARKLLELLEARRESAPLDLRFPVLVSRPSCPVAHLELSIVHPVVAGPARGTEEVGRYTFGRAEENDLAVDDVSVSRRHAALILGHDRAWHLVDCGSANGTYLDGVALVAGQASAVAPGLAVIRLGPHARFALMDETAFESYLDGFSADVATRRSPTRRARRPR
jgi:hypothetical protein